MKSLKIAASLFLLTSTSALAADLPSIKSVPVVAPTPLWTGFYAGLNAGYNWGANSNIISQNGGYSDGPHAGFKWLSAPTSMNGVISNNQYGFMGGGQVGYNYQFGSKIVVGIETDIQGSTTRGSGQSIGLSSQDFGGGGLSQFRSWIYQYPNGAHLPWHS
jgi:outer membrane immunogenic protein